jgi:hypothetical protein
MLSKLSFLKYYIGKKDKNKSDFEYNIRIKASTLLEENKNMEYDEKSYKF